MGTTSNPHLKKLSGGRSCTPCRAWRMFAFAKGSSTRPWPARRCISTCTRRPQLRARALPSFLSMADRVPASEPAVGKSTCRTGGCSPRRNDRDRVRSPLSGSRPAARFRCGRCGSRAICARPVQHTRRRRGKAGAVGILRRRTPAGGSATRTAELVETRRGVLRCNGTHGGSNDDSFSAIAALGRDASNAPPIVLARAGRDRFPEINSSIDRFVAAANSAGATVDLLTHPTGRHSFDILDPATVPVRSSGARLRHCAIVLELS